MTFVLSKHPALGTLWWVEIFSEISQRQTEEITTGLIDVISDFENKYSRFKDNSLLSELNKNQTLTNPDPEFRDLLNFGQKLYQETDGSFNILIGEELIARGYDANYSFKIKPEPESTSNPLTDLIVSDSLIKLKTGSIDLGGFGKGYLIDKLADKLRADYGLEEFLINGGGDIYATSENGSPITIHLEHPAKPGVFVGTTTLFNQAFAASSPHLRKWKVAGKTYNHIVAQSDTTTIDGVFVKAKTTALADAFATTALISSNDRPIDIDPKHHVEIAYFKDSKFIYNSFPDLIILDPQ